MVKHPEILNTGNVDGSPYAMLLSKCKVTKYGKLPEW